MNLLEELNPYLVTAKVLIFGCNFNFKWKKKAKRLKYCSSQPARHAWKMKQQPPGQEAKFRKEWAHLHVAYVTIATCYGNVAIGSNFAVVVHSLVLARCSGKAAVKTYHVPCTKARLSNNITVG